MNGTDIHRVAPEPPQPGAYPGAFTAATKLALIGAKGLVAVNAVREAQAVTGTAGALAPAARPYVANALTAAAGAAATAFEHVGVTPPKLQGVARAVRTGTSIVEKGFLHGASLGTTSKGATEIVSRGFAQALRHGLKALPTAAGIGAVAQTALGVSAIVHHVREGTLGTTAGSAAILRTAAGAATIAALMFPPLGVLGLVGVGASMAADVIMATEHIPRRQSPTPKRVLEE